MGLERDRRGRRLRTVGRFVVYYSIVAFSLVWVADVFVKWSVPHLVELLLLVISPSFVSGVLIYESRRNQRKPNTWLFIAAAEFHLLWVTLVVVYEAFQLDDVTQSFIRKIVVGAVLGGLVLSVLLYRRIKSLNAGLEIRGDESASSLQD